MELLQKIRKCLLHPRIILNRFFGERKWYQREAFRVTYYRRLQARTIKKIQQKNHATVVFFAVNVPMWRYQKLYEKLVSDNRFTVYVVIGEFDSYTKDANEEFTSNLIKFFRENNVDFIRLKQLESQGGVKSLNPDILFYTQPYEGLFGEEACYSNFMDKLLAYYPYGLQNLIKNWSYNTRFHNIAWRLYYPTSLHKNTATEFSAVKGRNVVVVGEPNADYYLSPVSVDPWKDKTGKIRIIWAPHFQIIPNGMFFRPSFLWTHDLMLEIASKYEDQVCIAFKPHPKLFSTLCNHPDWGYERAARYFSEWRSRDNTQYEDGDFIDLFKTSDALIHDCGSFTSEYQYTMKPCLFLTKDFSTMKEELCPFGMKSLDNHYIGQNENDVMHFIDDVLISGNDEKKSQREAFFNDYLIPPRGKSTAENTYDDIVTSLFLH